MNKRTESTVVKSVKTDIPKPSTLQTGKPKTTDLKSKKTTTLKPVTPKSKPDTLKPVTPKPVKPKRNLRLRHPRARGHPVVPSNQLSLSYTP